MKALLQSLVLIHPKLEEFDGNLYKRITQSLSFMLHPSPLCLAWPEIKPIPSKSLSSHFTIFFFSWSIHFLCSTYYVFMFFPSHRIKTARVYCRPCISFCITVPPFITHPSPYLLGGDSGTLPSWPPAFHHGNETRKHHTSSQDTENASKAVDIKGIATLSCLDWAVEVAGTVLGPPLEL